jgi:long-chain acyl-CoA synthetase
MPKRFATLVELCAQSCVAFAERPLFGTKKRLTWSFITYREFGRMVDRCRAGLHAAGVALGDRVGIVGNNGVEWAACAYASYGLGAAVVPMYEAQLVSEWEYILGDCGAKIAFAGTPEIAESLKAARPRLPLLRQVIGLAAPSDDPGSFAALLDRSRDAPVPPLQPPTHLPANLIYTSGTMGRPKGVVLSHGNIVSNVNALHEVFPFEPEDRSLSFLSWAHCFGQVELHTFLSMGCALALNRDVGQLLEDLAEVKPTILVAVPRVFHRLVAGVKDQIVRRPRVVRSIVAAGLRGAIQRSRGARCSVRDRIALRISDALVFSKVRARLGGRLKYAISGGAALGFEVGEFLDAIGVNVYEGYGLTETSPIVSANYRGHRRLGSVGKVMPGVRVVIDASASSWVDGEIIVYGPNVMQGYHNRPEENAAAMLPDGGLRTGDLGRMDADGYLYVTGRIKEQFKLENGKYVMPAPLEDELKLSPYIANALIYGDNKPYCVALIVLAMSRVEQWVEENQVDLANVTGDERVRALVRREIEERAAAFKKFELPKALLLVTDDFTVQNGLLTPTLKLKRRAILSRYRQALDALYTAPQGELATSAASRPQGA